MAGVLSVVAIGASMGGLNACRQVLRGLPAGFGAPVLIAQHRMAESEPLLVGLLAADTALTVVEPDDKAPLLVSHVYVAPGNYHMLVERSGQSIALSTEPVVRFARPSIDVLFESVAAALGSRGVAVVLTGASDDGARGAHSVKRAGGRVIVQAPESAESKVAPAAALSRFTPDAVLDLEQIAAQLCLWITRAAN